MSPDGVIRLNQRAVADTGEPHQLVSADLLASACERPRTYWHYDNVQDVVVLAVRLLLGLARNHPFLQGNKRTAFAAMIGFLGANGYRLVIADDMPNADDLIAAIAGQITDEAYIEAIRPSVVPIGRTFFEEAEPLSEAADEPATALELGGDSLGPLFSEWLVFYDEVHSPVTPDLIGRLCVVGLPDGRVVIKKLSHARTQGLYDLSSQTEDPILDAEVVWAAKVTGMTPR